MAANASDFHAEIHGTGGVNPSVLQNSFGGEKACSSITEIDRFLGYWRATFYRGRLFSEFRRSLMNKPWEAGKVSRTLLLVMPLFLLAGCGTWKSPSSSSWPINYHPELPYLLPHPYTRLYVEVDRMEGVEIPQEVFNDLKMFLSKYCRKSDGIEIAYSDVIPISECKGRSAEIVANLFIDGPPPHADNQTAYLYVLLEDSSKVGKKFDVGRSHTTIAYPCMIYYDVNFCRMVKNRVARNVMLHEAGHVLGLCRNTAHGDGSRCANDDCIMNSVPISISRSILQLPFKKQDLCADCQKDIEMTQAANPVSDMSFNGPFLVWRKDGWLLASLPVSDVAFFPGTNTFDSRDMLVKMKSYVRDHEQQLRNDPKARLRLIKRGDAPFVIKTE